MRKYVVRLLCVSERHYVEQSVVIVKLLLFVFYCCCAILIINEIKKRCTYRINNQNEYLHRYHQILNGYNYFTKYFHIGQCYVIQ